MGKSALECYKSLKEGLGALAVSYETVYRWVNAIKSDWEDRDDAPCSGAPTSATDECHVERVKSFLIRMHSVSCSVFAGEV